MKKGLISVVDYASILDLRSIGFARMNTSKRRGYSFGYSPGVALVTLNELSDRGCAMRVVRVVVMKQFQIDLPPGVHSIPHLEPK